MNSITKSKWMQLPRNIVIGHGVIHQINTVCKNLNLKDSEASTFATKAQMVGEPKASSALIVTGPTTKDIAGYKVKELLDKNYNTEIIIVKTATTKEVHKVQKYLKTNKFNFLVGVGGGKVIDITKLVSTQCGINFISVPTSASHDGIASSRASLKDEKNGKNTSIAAQAPLGVVADTAIIASAPYRFLASGCGDIISNCTAVLDWKLSNRLKNTPYSEYASALSQMTAQKLLEASDGGAIKPGLEESAWIVVKALVASGVAMSIAGSSRPASGAEHKFSHALDQIAPKPALHGEQCGVGAIMMMYLHGGNWQKIRSALKKIGAPVNAKELNIKEEYIIEALVKANSIRPERYTILGTGLTRDAAIQVAKITKVI
ncbi:MAG: NAD(P)-dependent glycerol-1-phosphate dehydrogenase [Methanosarcinales archaeon]